MMLRRRTSAKLNEAGQGEDEKVTGNAALAGDIVLIDFGLAVQTVQEEDRAVDLYVLERAFGSTHPREEGMFGELLEGYRVAFKGSKGTLRRLEDVRMRGRKKSMIG
jgi:TP53 regulating kinase-like protein